MTGQVHQLFATEADRDAAWERFAALGRELQESPALIRDRPFMERLWTAEREAKRLFNVHLEQEARG